MIVAAMVRRVSYRSRTADPLPVKLYPLHRRDWCFTRWHIRDGFGKA